MNRRSAAAALGLAALVLTGCASADGGSTPAADKTAGPAYPEVHALLPDDVIERGYITNMAQIPNAPL